MPLDVESRERTGGRRGPDHEFPQRDRGDAEDTGGKVPGLKITGFVHGDDYMAGRDRLQAALEKPGSCTYVDPWQKEWQVVVRSWSCKESTREGGMARFSIDIKEAGGERYPSQANDTRYKVDQAAGTLSDVAVEDFTQSFRVDKLPQFVADAATDVTKSFGAALSDASSLASGAPFSVVNDFTDNAANAVRGDLGGEARTVMETVSASLYSDRVSAPGDPSAVSGVFKGLSDFGGSLLSMAETTATRAVQAANQAAQTRLFKVLSLSEEARATARVVFDSYDDAIAVRDNLTGRLDQAAAVVGSTGSDGLFRSLGNLRTAVVTDINARSGGLPRVRRLQPNISEPAVVLAHRIYGDATRSDELLRRNKHITHGGFVSPGQSLEILNE